MLLFSMVAAAGSFTRAARMSQIPTATLSRRISVLEEQIGVKLLHRSTRNLALTQVGQHYLQRVVELLDHARAISSELEGEMDRLIGNLRVCVPVDFDAYFPESLLSEYCDSLPGVTVELRCSPELPDLVSDPYDVCISVNEPPGASWVVRRHIGDVRYQLYASPTYLQDFGAPVRPADLVRHRCILMTDAESGLSLTGKEGHVRVSVPPLLVLNNQLTLESLLCKGLGVGPLSRRRAAPLVASGVLAPVLPQWALEPKSILALTASRRLPARVEAFIERLAASLRE